MDTKLPEKNRFQQCLDKCKSAFKVVFLFSCCVNLFLLITPLYSLQILDRYLGTGSFPTLIWLSVIIAIIHLAKSLIQIARSFTLIKTGEWLDNNVSPLLFSYSVSSNASKSSMGTSQILRDFQSLKQFLTSRGINTVLDAPWSIVFIAVIFWFHHYLGYLTIIGAIILLIFAYLNASATNNALSEANEVSVKSMSVADIANRNAETIEAMGMMNNVSKNWFKFNSSALAKQSEGSYRNGIISNTSGFVRNLIQMGVTGIGGYLVVSTQGTEMTAGGMIASSIIVGRALAPVDQAIELWKDISNARKSYKRINWTLDNATNREENLSLPDVSGHISVDNLYYAPPQNPLKQGGAQPSYILKGVNFTAEPGSALAILGPSGSGKSTLAKLMVGVWQPASGDVRLDGAEVYKWNREDFGKHIGYVPQGIELFGGSVKQNIARMAEEVDAEKVVEAAKMAGAHDMILKFPDSYDTDIGVGGSNLSGGQRQRIALARAFYNNPEVLILDEPNANLDEEGEQALAEAIVKAKEKEMNVIIISHRPSLLNSVDKVLLLKDGSVAAFGSKEDVIGDANKSGNNSNRITSKNK